MDDKFLYQNRPPVRPGFGESLYARLSIMTPQNKTSTKRAIALRLVLAGLIVFMLVLTFSESVRADVWYWIRYIAGFEVQEVDNLHEIPGYDEGSSSIIHPSFMAHALKFLSFEFALPAYTPDGYVLVDRLVYQDTTVWLSWVNQDQEEISMFVNKLGPDFEPGTIIGSNSAEEIQINGQPAMLVHGSYNTNDEWDPNFKRISIYLIKDGLSYTISNNPHSPIATSVEEFEKELIHMAGSIPDMKKDDHETFSALPQPAEDILQNPPFAFEMPSYVPDGFLPEEGRVADSKAWVSIYWQNEKGERIGLMVQQDSRITIPPGVETAKKKLFHNGRSALLIHGGYDKNGRWDASKKDIQLYWREGGLIYILSSDTVNEDELIKIAESIE